MFILLSVSVFAEPPFITNSQEVGQLQIINPKFEYYPEFDGNKVHFHVYNSTGHPMTNTSITCEFHLYNTSSHVIQNNNMNFDAPYDFEQAISLPRGVYSYVVQCSPIGVGEYGSISSAFEVLPGKLKQPTSTDGLTGSITFILLFMISISLILAYFILKHTDKIISNIGFIVFGVCLFLGNVILYIILSTAVNQIYYGVFRVLFIVSSICSTIYVIVIFIPVLFMLFGSLINWIGGKK